MQQRLHVQEGEGVCIYGGIYILRHLQQGVCIWGMGRLGRSTKIHRILWDMVNKLAVCILLECILVNYYFYVFQPLKRVDLKSVMDIHKCHLCKLDNNHYARPADNFDLILHNIATSFVADVDITVFAHHENNAENRFQEYSNRTTVTVSAQQVC